MERAMQLMEDAANMLRGMTMDPTIPGHAKAAMRLKIVALEDLVGDLLYESEMKIGEKQ